MTVERHRLFLLRHGETEWSANGRHTGTTDLELTEVGRDQARLATEAIAALRLTNPLVFSSPRRRALVTAELAGLTVHEVTPLLAEWDYGDYEGLTTPQIRETVSGWTVWTHGSPGGESVSEVAERADRAVDLALAVLEAAHRDRRGSHRHADPVADRQLHPPHQNRAGKVAVADEHDLAGVEV